MHSPPPRIDRYEAWPVQQLRETLRALRSQQDDATWPAAQLRACADSGVLSWFLPTSYGGAAWSPEDLIRGYIALSSGCLTTAFVLTQCMGACQRIASSQNQSLRDELLPDLVVGRRFATLGISQLTTSQRHLGRPALLAQLDDADIIMDGRSPWVTGAGHTDLLILGAATEDGRQVLCAVEANHPNVQIKPAPPLVGLTGSQTSEVELRRVRIARRQLLAGPSTDLMSRGGANTGGLQTSALAIGLATEAIDYLLAAAEQRPELLAFAEPLSSELSGLTTELLFGASAHDNNADSTAFDALQFRSKANSLVLRATQGALLAAKGSGYVRGHPAGRWCQEALFFLVWSCPRPVMENYFMELAYPNGGLSALE